MTKLLKAKSYMKFVPQGIDNFLPRTVHTDDIWALLENGRNIRVILQKDDGGRVDYELVDVRVCTLCDRPEEVASGLEDCPACEEPFI